MSKRIQKPELVTPAGDWPSLIAAIESGADSVYFGIKGLNMRNLAPNFEISELPKIMELLHSNNKKGYLTLNVLVMSRELPVVRRILNEAKKSKVDAVILWDMAVLSLARELGLEIHLSTQASVANAQAALFFSQLGVKRIVLARECSLDDIKEISRYIADNELSLQLEVFVHGAMCVSISGRCFMSQYSFGKSANRGECLQPCRREYYITDMQDADYHMGKDYILSPKDLCALGFLKDLISSGVHACKIEGRMKSAEYIKTVVSVYRRGIDAVGQGSFSEELQATLRGELETVYHRGFSDGFFFGDPSGLVSQGPEHDYEKIFIGRVTKFYKKISVAQIKLTDHALKKGDMLLFLGKYTPARQAAVEEMQIKHQPKEEASKGEEVGLKLPFRVRCKDKVFLWRRKAGSNE